MTKYQPVHRFIKFILAPKCMGCCIADGTKPSPSSPRSADKPKPKTSSKPLPCKKCNRTIPAGNQFYEVNNAPKCKDCC
ncbi:hypothetical protein OSTOST_12487, partial [Ostertagia ostertagi]